MPSANPPQQDVASRDEFMTNGINAHDKCNICLEGFDSTHIPSSFAKQGSCSHVFGEKCLREWLLSANSNANKCPTCRKVFFHRQEAAEGQIDSEDEDGSEESAEDRGEDFRESEAESETESETESEEGDEFPRRLKDITNPNHAYEFAEHLISELSNAYKTSYNNVFVTFDEACTKFGMGGCEDFTLIRKIVYDMIKEAEAPVGVSERRIRRYWVPRLGRHLGWQLDATMDTETRDGDPDDRWAGDSSGYDSMDEW
ncbi:hypothetical protein N0V95_002815 [Ascochyta clinopodiicola]|nr:hypothetical protein N0V95_002815 [Ascochyta clinopodiicola]